MTADEHSSRLINWHESVEKWCKVEDLGVQSYKVKMEIPSLYQPTGCDKFPLWVCFLFISIYNYIVYTIYIFIAKIEFILRIPLYKQKLQGYHRWLLPNVRSKHFVLLL